MQTSEIVKALDSLGYNKGMVEKRSWIGKKISEGSTIYHRKKYGENIDVVLTGSRREGIATSIDNDVDQMFVDNAVLCTETKSEAFNNDNKYHAAFVIDTQTAPEGYTFLELVRISTNDAGIPIELKNALTEYRGSIFLQNDKVKLKAVSPLLGSVKEQLKKGGWMKKTIQLNEEKNGPSVSYALLLPYVDIKIKFDDCLAFQCNASSLLKTWCSRERKCDWPPKRLIKQIEEMPGHVVPVGLKGHPDHLLQWRICFTQAEIALVQTFTDTQIKVYAVMKNLSKYVFKTVCRGVTSYIMKNVIFWISEEVPMVEFERNYFPERIHHALNYLKGCISMRMLPSYMIESRNLLEGKMSEKQQVQLLQLIERFTSEGPCVALRIPEVQEEVTHPNEEMQKKKLRRNNFLHQVFLSPFVLPSKYDIADFLINLLDEPTPEKILDLYMRHIIPYIKTHNPQGFFNILLDDYKLVYHLLSHL